MQSMQDLPLLNPFFSSNSSTYAIAVNLFAIILNRFLYPLFNKLIPL
jgi:hypothetical protein